MKKIIAITSTVLAASLLSAASFAEQPRREFNKSVKHNHPRGEFTRTVEQRRIENGIQRTQTIETADGRSAERQVTRTRDRDAGIATRTVEGTRLNGDTYSGETVRRRTDNGYIQNSTRTNANGETATRDQEVVIDREAGTVTKTIDYTKFNGETGSRNVVIERPTPAHGGES